MAKILLAAHPTAGHTNALRAIGVELLARGHDVAMTIAQVKLPFAQIWPEIMRVAATLPEQIANDGIEILPFKNLSLSALWYGAKIPRAHGQEELDAALHLFTASLVAQSKNIAQHIQNWQADAVLGDYLMPAAKLAADLKNIPYIAFYHSALPFKVENAAPFGSDLSIDKHDSITWKKAIQKVDSLDELFQQKVNSAALKLGLSERKTSILSSPISEHLNLLATSPELEPGLFPLHGPVVMTGPCLPAQQKNTAENRALNLFQEKKGIRIYLSLGTVFNEKPKVFEEILQGLSTLNAQVIVSAGGCYARLQKHQSDRIHIFKRVPQVQLLKQIDLMITHGGNNTVQETIAAGKCMVVLPFGGDQIVNAQRVERLKVGQYILPHQLHANSLKKTVQDVLKSEASILAHRLGKSLQNYGGTKQAATEVLRLLEPMSAP